ncbi:hypothetical protein BWZ22_09740 [Seonamhaeicola sp. S2-3]|nr:hypothetical protein BWZ22_09740 [Seonamhaeicola sp. S2-3]
MTRLERLRLLAFKNVQEKRNQTPLKMSENERARLQAFKNVRESNPNNQLNHEKGKASAWFLLGMALFAVFWFCLIFFTVLKLHSWLYELLGFKTQ